MPIYVIRVESSKSGQAVSTPESCVRYLEIDAYIVEGIRRLSCQPLTHRVHVFRRRFHCRKSGLVSMRALRFFSKRDIYALGS